MVNFFAEMKGSKKLVYTLLLFLGCQPIFGLDLTKTNLAHQYDLSSEIRFSSRTIEKDESLVIFYKVKTDSSLNWRLDFLTQKGYNSPKHDTLVSYTIDTLLIRKDMSLIKLKLNVPPTHDLLLLVFTNLETSIEKIFDVSLSSTFGFPEFYPVDKEGLPIIESYINTDEIQFNDPSGTYHVYHYGQKFIGTDPPMGSMKALAPTLDIDTAYMFQSKIEGLNDDTFYLFQRDSLDQSGFALLKTPYYFPETKRIDELIGPMQYITTDSENKSLNSGVDTKAVFERFWINTYGTKYRAKGAIRAFYGKVQESNRLFTDYKAGWKTDRGMLYIVFGNPDIVIRTKNSEIWRYTNGVEFEFIRISTLFAPSMYSLKRDLKYEEIWYNRVGEIRKG